MWCDIVVIRFGDYYFFEDESEVYIEDSISIIIGVDFEEEDEDKVDFLKVKRIILWFLVNIVGKELIICKL